MVDSSNRGHLELRDDTSGHVTLAKLDNKYKPARLYFDSYTPQNCNADLSPVIFVHGLFGLHTTWSRVWRRIADKTRRKVFAIDLRNHGKSEWNDIFELDALVTDLENFAVENGSNKYVFLGHSLGGRVCMRIALTKPELVERLIIEETFVDYFNWDIHRQVIMLLSELKKIELLPKNMDLKEIRTLLSSVVEKKFPEWGMKDAAYNYPLRKKPDGSIGLDFNVEVIEKFFKDKSAYMINFDTCMKFFGPAIFFYFKGTPTKVNEDTSVKKYFPNAELQEFSRKVHVLHLGCPDEYVQHVTTFLNR